MSILKSTSWSLRGIIGFVIEMSQPGLNETLTEVFFLSAVTHLSLSSPVLPTFRCPTEYTLNWTHLLLQCLTLNFTESKSKGCWKRVARKRKRTKRKRKKNLRSLFYFYEICDQVVIPVRIFFSLYFWVFAFIAST